MNYQKQAEKFAKKFNVTLKIGKSIYASFFKDDKEDGTYRYVFNCTLERNREKYRFKFGQCLAKGNTSPTMYDILAGLTHYDPEDFETFCDNFGYCMDSRSDYKVYLAVCKEWKAVERLFGDCLEQLQEIN